MNRILTGTAVMDMEPPVGLDMSGFYARPSGCEGIHDSLKIRCMVFSSGSTGFVFASCDLVGLDSEFVRKTVKLAAKSVPIPEENFVIACTHTHSGPASINLLDCGEINGQWLDSLELKIVECIKKAAGNLKPSLLTFRTGSCRIGLNRIFRNKPSNDTICSPDNIDDQVGILIVRDASDNRITAVIVNYACHLVSLTHTNLLYSADYSHYLEEYLLSRLQEDACFIFAEGCCGDIDPVKMGSFEYAKSQGEELGRVVADAVECDCRAGVQAEDDIRIETLKVEIPLDFKMDVKHFEEQKRIFSGKIDDKNIIGTGTRAKSIYRSYVKWADMMMEKLSVNKLSVSVTADIKIVKIGRFVMVTLPFEVFHDIGIKIKKHFGPDNTMVIGYSNGDFGYLPSEALYPAAAYEAGEAYRFYCYPGPVARNAERIVLDAVTGSIFH